MDNAVKLTVLQKKNDQLVKSDVYTLCNSDDCSFYSKDLGVTLFIEDGLVYLGTEDFKMRLSASCWTHVGDYEYKLELTYRGQKADWTFQSKLKQIASYLLGRRCARCKHFDRDAALSWYNKVTHTFLDGTHACMWKDVTDMCSQQFKVRNIKEDTMGLCKMQDRVLSKHTIACKQFGK